jgi:phytol kinase
MSEALRGVAVGTGFLLIFAAAELWRRYGNPPVEWSRKFVHFTGGLLVLAFPWIFTSRWAVLALVSVFSVLIWGTRRAGLLRSVHGVTRESHGSLFYPLAVVILFTISHGQPAFYLASALALVVSDTAAALVGSTYGRNWYDVGQDRRSIEGSVSFFLATFLAVHVTLLLMTGVDRSVSVLVAVQVALVVTLFEGISLNGSDNLFVPLATYHLLLRLTPESPAVIAGHTGVVVAILVLLSLLARRSRLMKTSGVMAASLFFYLIYSLAGPEWMLAPVLGFVGIVGMRACGRGVPLRRTRRIAVRAPDPPLGACRMNVAFSGRDS